MVGKIQIIVPSITQLYTFLNISRIILSYHYGNLQLTVFTQFCEVYSSLLVEMNWLFRVQRVQNTSEQETYI